MYMTLAFLALQGAPYIYIYDISSLRVKFTHYLYMVLITYFVDTNIIFLENKHMG